MKSGNYSETTEETFRDHRTRSDWVGVEGFNYGPSHEYLPPPPPLDSTSEKKSTSGRTGHYDADKLTETVTINGVSSGKKDYPLGGSRVFQALGPGGLTPVAPWVQHESAWWLGAADFLADAANLVRTVGKPLDRTISSSIPFAGSLLGVSSQIAGVLDGLGEAATIIGREGGLTWDSAYVAGGTAALTQLGVRDLLDGWEGEDAVGGEDLDGPARALRFASGALTLGATIFGAAGYVSKAIRASDRIVKGIRQAGRFDATFGTLADARAAVLKAFPNAVELPPAVPGHYPSPPRGVKQWFQLHPAEPDVGNQLPHIKYADWTLGKKGSGGSWGHLFFSE